jgi:hypothetical protein
MEEKSLAETAVAIPKPTRAHIIVKNPIEKIKSNLHLTEDAKKNYMKEQMQKIVRATIVAAGKDVTEVNVGDDVYIKNSRFLMGEPLCDGDYLLFTEGDVLAVY